MMSKKQKLLVVSLVSVRDVVVQFEVRAAVVAKVAVHAHGQLVEVGGGLNQIGVI